MQNYKGGGGGGYRALDSKHDLIYFNDACKLLMQCKEFLEAVSVWRLCRDDGMIIDLLVRNTQN